MPDELARAPESPKSDWLGTMLKLKTGKNIAFSIEEGSSLKFSSFLVDPHKVDNPILEAGSYPFPVVACGDSLMSAEYRKGTGIFNGIVCANGLVNATRYIERKFQVDSHVFKGTTTSGLPTGKCIDDHVKEVKSSYQARNNRFADIRVQKDRLAIFLKLMNPCLRMKL